MTDPGYVRITSAEPETDLTLLLGLDPVVLSGGFGGWEIAGRPRQVGMTLWQGVEPLQAQLPLMLDGYTAGVPVERTLRRLVRCARGTDDSEPGVVEVEGVALPADEWVIEDVSFGDPIRSNDQDLKLLRQPLTLVLREYVPPEYLQLRRRALTRRRPPTRVVTTKKGDTLARLARRYHCKWTAIRDLNPKLKRKANALIKTGVKVRIPAARRKKKKRGGRKGAGGA